MNSIFLTKAEVIRLIHNQYEGLGFEETWFESRVKDFINASDDEFLKMVKDAGFSVKELGHNKYYIN
jgi:hypothetical protein